MRISTAHFIFPSPPIQDSICKNYRPPKKWISKLAKTKVIHWVTTIFQIWQQWTTTSNKYPKKGIFQQYWAKNWFSYELQRWIRIHDDPAPPLPVTLQGERLSTLHPVWVVPLQLGQAPGCSYHHCGIGLMLRPQVMSSCQPSTNWSKIEIFHQLVVEPTIWKILVKIRIFPKKKGENNKYLKPTPKYSSVGWIESDIYQTFWIFNLIIIKNSLINNYSGSTRITTLYIATMQSSDHPRICWRGADQPNLEGTMKWHVFQKSPAEVGLRKMHNIYYTYVRRYIKSDVYMKQEKAFPLKHFSRHFPTQFSISDQFNCVF